MFSFERGLYNCKSLDRDYIDKYYPPTDIGVLRNVRIHAEDNEEQFQIYGSLRKNYLGEDFIEIIFYSKYYYPEILFRRFIIQNGYMMNEADEKEYTSVIHRALICINLDDFAKLLHEAQLYCPEAHICDYNPVSLKYFLEHLYYATHISGAREILYKAGFPRLAFDLDNAFRFNVIGSNPEEIYGLPINLLRILESTVTHRCVRTYKEKKKALTTYEEFRDHFGKHSMPNRYQWLYLMNYRDFSGHGNEPFSKTLYNRLADIEEPYCFDEYKDYIRLKYEMGENPYHKIPDSYEISVTLRILSGESKFIRNTEKLDKDIKKNNISERFAYEDDEFIVVTPVSSIEFIKEARAQANCLSMYANLVASGETNIVFVRRKKFIKESYVTVEIRNGIVCQYRARFNKLPSGEVLAFLEKFADFYNLIFDPLEDILEPIYKDVEDSVKEYVTGYIRRKGVTSVLDPKLNRRQVSIFEEHPEWLFA